MQILRLGGKTLRFMSLRKVAMCFSTLLIIASLASLFVKGLNFGLDFTGGTAVEVGFSQPADLKKVRNVLAENDFADASVQRIDDLRWLARGCSSNPDGGAIMSVEV